MDRVRADPGGELRLSQVRCGQIEHHLNDLGFGDIQFVVVDAQEGVDGHESYSFVAIDETVIRDQSVAVCRSKICEINALLVRPLVPRSIQGRLDQPLFANTKTAAVLPNLIGVDNADGGA